MYSLGVVSISFRPYSPREILAAMQRAGLTCIEWGSDVHAPCDDEAALTAIAQLQAEYGITCCSYGTYFKLGVTPIEELERYILAAKRLGTDVLRLWCGSKGSADHTAQETEELFALCRQAAAIAATHGVTLCMECHGYTYTDTKESALALMQAVDSPHFRMYWQPCQTPAENEAYAALLAPYTEHLHVFNWVGMERFPLAQGLDHWRRYLQVLGGSHTLLLEFMPDDDLATLDREAAALKELVGDRV